MDWFMDLVYQMLVVMPDTRITAVDALAHPFLTIMHFIKYPSTAMTKKNAKLMESCKLDIWIDSSPRNLYSSGLVVHTSDLKISQHCAPAPPICTVGQSFVIFYKNILHYNIALYLLYKITRYYRLEGNRRRRECDNNTDNRVQYHSRRVIHRVLLCLVNSWADHGLLYLIIMYK